jgi:hypothetical protein
MDLVAVRDTYKMWMSNPQIGPTAFQTVSLAFAKTHPAASTKAAALYVTLGAARSSDKPLGSSDYVGGLYDIALAQPRQSTVSGVVAMAVGMAALPADELGTLSANERYLMLHGAAQLAQQEAAKLGKQLATDWQTERRASLIQ